MREGADEILSPWKECDMTPTWA